MKKDSDTTGTAFHALVSKPCALRYANVPVIAIAVAVPAVEMSSRHLRPSLSMKPDAQMQPSTCEPPIITEATFGSISVPVSRNIVCA